MKVTKVKSWIDVKNKEQKGITLIALVITIIVLLILAGISINLLLGENGIIKRAGEAKEEWNRAETEEKAGLQNLEDKVNEYTNGGAGVTPTVTPTEEPREPEGELDYTELYELLDEIEELDEDEYTVESWEELAKLIPAEGYTAENQDEIDELVEKLREAIDDLEWPITEQGDAED